MKSTSEVLVSTEDSIDCLRQSDNASRWRINEKAIKNALAKDETIDLYISTLANTYARSKKDRDLFQRRIAQSLNQKIKLLSKIGQVILDEEIQDEQLRGKIYDQVTPEELSTAMAECKSLIRPHADDYFDFFALRYSYLRQFTPTFLAAFGFSSNRQPDDLIG